MKTRLNIKTDIKLKKQAQETAGRLGLPLSVVINNYLKEFIEARHVVFSERPEIPNKPVEPQTSAAVLPFASHGTP